MAEKSLFDKPEPPTLLGLKIAEMLAALRTLAATPEGRERIKRAAEAHGIEGGRPWSKFSFLEIETLHLFAIAAPAGEWKIEMPPPRHVEIPWTPDDSTEGVALNKRCDDLGL